MAQNTETGTPGPADIVVQNIGFLLVPDFSPMGYFGALEVLRTANRYLGRSYYGWCSFSLDGTPVVTASGVSITVDRPIVQDLDLAYFFVCAGFHPEQHCQSKTLARLREFNRHGTKLGAISTGTYILAESGIVGDRQCTIHGENLASLKEKFYDLNIVDSIFEIDRDLYTSSGGTSAIDMFIHLVASAHGWELSASIAPQFQQDRVRSSMDFQSKYKNLGLQTKSPKIAQAISIMENNIENPLFFSEICNYLDITPRQLQRLFKQHVGSSPKEHYLNLRLNHSRLLLLQTSLPIVEVAIASGFAAASHFAKCYKCRYGYSPNLERKNAL